ncbi:MAG: flagellar biosynthetic protein FliO [Deltaproteobacteria bacterium]|nr:flagellar biosynthetic protein FliO [Deltaproteobacteria bacterium]
MMEPTTLPAVAAPISFGWLFVKMVGVLGLLVLSLLFIGKWFLPRLGKGRFSLRQEKGRISVIERFPLEQRKTLYLLKVAQKYLLVGTGDHSVQLLGEFEKNEME